LSFVLFEHKIIVFLTEDSAENFMMEHVNFIFVDVASCFYY